MPKPVAARLDPFQNIVNISGEAAFVLFIWRWSDWYYPANSDVMIGAGPSGGQPPPGSAFVAATDVELHIQGPRPTHAANPTADPTAEADIEVEIEMNVTNPEISKTVLVNDPETVATLAQQIGPEHLGDCGLWEPLQSVLATTTVWRPAQCPVPPATFGPPFLPRNIELTTDIYSYTKSFLFRLGKLPTDFNAILTGIGTGMNSVKSLGHYATAIPGQPYDPTVPATVDPPVWGAYVFPPGVVEYYPDDPVVPLRKIGNPNPTAGAAEALAEADTSTGPIGVHANAPLAGVVKCLYEDGTYLQKLDLYTTTFDPPTNKIVWPVTPADIVTAGLHFGQYRWSTDAGSSAVISNGTPPGTPVIT
jgi:hypothetical protein